MKKIILITEVDFWRQGAGHRMRILQMLNYLKKIYNVTIAYLGQHDNTAANWLVPGIEFACINGSLENNKKDTLVAVSALFENTEYVACIIEFIHLSYFLACVPENTITILDAHDIVNERSEGFANYKYPIWGYHISKETEYKLFRLFDYVMVICDNDLHKLRATAPDLNVILAPHPVPVKKHAFNLEAISVGFIGSEYTPNVDAIGYFLKEVWPFFDKHTDVTLNIYGNVCQRLRGLTIPRVTLNGFIPDLDKVYEEINVVINPVRFGAGLKIKNIEALANGLPLITTHHGARGLEPGMGTAFLVAENAGEYLDCLNGLVSSSAYRQKIGNDAAEFVQKNFTEEQCFEGLLKAINHHAAL